MTVFWEISGTWERFWDHWWKNWGAERTSNASQEQARFASQERARFASRERAKVERRLELLQNKRRLNLSFLKRVCICW